jgi:hypothetical protein
MTLAAIQADFRDRLLRDDPHPGLGIYRATYRAQLMDCLADTYAATRLWLGEAPFDAHAAGFIDAHPPQSWSLDHYPARFPDWLDDATARDLCRIEWALAETFVAPDEPVVSIAMLGEVDWNSARLRLAGTARWLDLSSNAAEIWVALQQGEVPPPARAMQAAVLVWRQGMECRLRDGSPIEARILPQGAFAFADLCELACADHGEEAGIAMAGALLAQWAQEEAMALTDARHAPVPPR